MLCISCAIILTRKKADERNAAIRLGCGTASRTHSVMQSATQSFSAGHIIAVIRVFDDAGNVIETHKHVGDFKEWLKLLLALCSRFALRFFFKYGAQS